MSVGGNKSKLAYEEAQRKYLEAGKKYSGFLKIAMDLDPNIIKIAEEILVTGDRISVHDNKLLTRFYNELRVGSKIDKKYYELLINLKKAKNELDIATDRLLAKRVGNILSSAGIPPRVSNLSRVAKVSHLNNPGVGLLEKISLPGVLSIALATELDQLVLGNELKLTGGKAIPETKKAKDFLKKLEKEIRESINEDYLLSSASNTLHDINSPRGAENLLELIRVSADKEHVREIERRLDAGDIRFANSTLEASTAKGQKYLSLLAEELTSVLARKVESELLLKNQRYQETDPRLVRSRQAVDSLCDSLKRHDRFNGFVDKTVYNELLLKLKNHRGAVVAKMCSLLTQIETISRAFMDIKKRLISTSSQGEVDIDSLLSLLVAARHLSKFESGYERELAELENLLGIKGENSGVSFGPRSTHSLAEAYCHNNCAHLEEADTLIRDIVAGRMSNRKSLDEQSEKVLQNFVLSPESLNSYKGILCSQSAIRNHIADTDYANGSLYQGIGDLSSLIEELVELEVERREKLADFIHEFELTHKELWLSSIKKENQSFISSNFPNLPTKIHSRADEANALLVSDTREEVKSVLDKYRKEHRVSSESFGKQLKTSLDKLKLDGDVVGTSAKLKDDYKKMLVAHDQALSALEIEIGVLERKLCEFESSSKSNLEKVLLDDIRKNI